MRLARLVKQSKTNTGKNAYATELWHRHSCLCGSLNRFLHGFLTHFSNTLACLLLIPLLLPAETPKLPEPYQSIAEQAHSVSPEFAADALLRLVESRKITNAEAQRDLLEQAFRLASSAKFRVRMRGLPGSLVDTRSGYLSRAYDLKLDTLSLASRAVRDMAPIDSARARAMFQEILRPVLAPLTCDDALVYDVSDYYRTLGMIVDSSFNEKERKKDEHINFFLDYLQQATSPAQLAPLAAAIKTVGVTPEQRAILWNRLAGLLENMQPDDRSFSASLAEVERALPQELHPSLERYRNKSSGCKDDAAVTAGLTNAEPQPAKTGSTPKIERYWESMATHMLLEGAKKLRFGNEGKPLTDADRSSQEWQQQLTDYLRQLGEWVPGQEKSEADYYHQKCVVYEALVELIPAGPQRDTILTGYLDFIGNSSLQQESPVEWFMHAHSMLERVRSTNSGEPAKVLEGFQKSGNPILALYAALERTFGSSVPAWVPSN
jgi:hypothetical protein